MKRLPTEVVKQRTRELSKLFQSYKPYDRKVRRDSSVCVGVLCTRYVAVGWRETDSFGDRGST